MDEETRELYVSADDIRQASLAYCKKVLSKNQVEDDFQNEIELNNRLHEIRMMEDDQKMEDEDLN